MSGESWSLLIAMVTAVTCGLCGSILVAGRQAMVSEGLSHAVLPGLVIAFIIFRSFDSPWLIVSAAASGLVMVLVAQTLADTRLIDADAGLGLVFAGMFSVGILLVSLHLKNAHFHADCIIDGNLALASIRRVDLPVIGRVPRSMITMSVMLMVVFASVMFAYKEIKAMIFDPTHSAQVGLRPVLFRYGWMSLVSLTAVTAFHVAGSVLIVALMVAPAASAFLLTRAYGLLLCLAMAIAAVSAVAGFYLARWIDISPTGPIASVAGMVFLLVFILNPTSGLLSRWVTRRRRRWLIARCLACELVVGCESENEAVEALVRHLGWRRDRAKRVFDAVRELKWLNQEDESEPFVLTDTGRLAIERETCPKLRSGSA